MADSIHVFVYGTLRRGEKNHYLMSGCTCIAEEAYIDGKLYDSRFGYPFLTTSSGIRVYGELYNVPIEKLPFLDELEDYTPNREDNLYERVVHPIYIGQATVQAYVYISNRPDLHGTLIESGDWKQYNANKEKSS
ncbi:gamma-glutamylcyclotransferase [Bacillus sp. 03113]|uniref:gamma-glutamylcyclotransferase family protein n=1 Tax=Bacillus sp. 03113 TaxID=2578211 RepID=UPI001141DB60|nr:gamma-glutamylcyclotransferase family protein [Bacillus sp. 03113]